ncbi:ribosomal-processing cysteine protease Prp [Mediterraneibacter agrestimuris]|uniref:ribosomal-processing cysteine protease Prp n=1 Tax=Mediterraneibacter agrestimuris TaxID=2941333 RepID=UPI00204063D1|nr:ribosomal-processing cysteine protease Prp [Mediterraneibacter agrestimuris]
MIHATVYVNENHAYTGFDFIGHAEYSKAGTDIVCAAASMLVINTLNAIERYTSDETSCVSNEDEGMIEFRFREEPTHDAQLLVKTMLLGLESLEDNNEYEPYIDIIFEEV